MKFCKICKTEKENYLFYKDKTRKGGLSYSCKECNKTRCHKHYNEHKEEYKRLIGRNFLKKIQINAESIS